MINPYHSPAMDDSPPPCPMSRHQRKTLEFYWKHRARRLTMGQLIWLVLTKWAMMLVLLLALGLANEWLPVGGQPQLDWLLLLLFGFASGLFARDYAYLRSMVHLWPVLDEVFDWNAIQAKLEKS